MTTGKMLIAAAVVAGAVAWYLFRPERLLINQTVEEAFPGETAAAGSSAMPKVLASGNFHGVAHKTIGMAAIHEVAGGKRVLRFTNSQTSNGPDVQVYLVTSPDANDNETVTRAGFLHLGALKGNPGDQNYDVPADADLNKYRAVTVWCRRFGVNFATAPLMPQNN